MADVETAPAFKTFDARDVGTITTGTVLNPAGFRNVPALFEHVMGHPVWTHEMPALLTDATARILAVVPDFPTEAPSDFVALGTALQAQYPEGVTLPRGDAVRIAGPMTTMRNAMRDAR